MENKYEGEALDGTAQYISERDFERVEENTDVPQEALEDGELTAEYGFIHDEDLSKKERVKRLYDKRDYNGYRSLHGDCTILGLDVSKTYINKLFLEWEEETEEENEGLESRVEELEEEKQELYEKMKKIAETTEQEFQEVRKRDEELTEKVDSLKEQGVQDQGEFIPIEELEKRVLEPLELSKEFSDSTERRVIKRVENRLNEVLNEYKHE